jgi:predicted MFS family arabinose efflux permease
VRPPRAEAAATTSDKGGTDDGGMLRGLKELWRDRTIRLTLTMISLLNVSGFALFLSVVVLLRNAGESPRGIGIAVAGEAVGTLIGAALVGRLHRLMGPGKLLVAVSAWLTAMLPLLAVPLGAWWVFGVIAVAMLGIPSLRVLLDVLILRQVPDERRGRTIAAVMTVITVGAPIGTMVAGLSLQFLSPVTTILGICALQVVALAPLVADARLRAAAWPAS